MKRILYLTDKAGISEGYRYQLNKILIRTGLKQGDVITTDIYGLMEGRKSPLYKFGNRSTWSLNPQKMEEVISHIKVKINAVRPSLIVTCCPAVLGVLVDCAHGPDIIDNSRGGVYEFDGIPVIVTYPMSALNRKKDEKGSDDNEEVNTYKVPSGAWILVKDWEKISRFYKGKVRELPEFDWSLVRTEDDAKATLQFLSTCKLISTDVETVGAQLRYATSCVGYTGLSDSGKVKSFVFPSFDKFSNTGIWADDPELFDILHSYVQKINALEIPMTMANGTYDCSYYVLQQQPVSQYLLDCQHLWHALFPELRKSLDFVSSILIDRFQYWKADIKGIKNDYQGKKDTTMMGYYRYNALDCYYTLFNTLYLWHVVSRNPAFLHNYIHEFMMALSGWKMSMKGIKADKDVLFKHKLRLIDEVAIADERLRYISAMPDFNSNSTPDKKFLLYDLLGAQPRNDKGKVLKASSPRSQTPKASTGKNALKMIKWEHPLNMEYVNCIEASVQPKHRISSICNMAIATNRFRYKLGAGTETWRYKCKASDFWDGTNGQNITKKMRDFMIADDHHLLFDVDYSQSDSCYVAYESNDARYIELVRSGKDSHAHHAQEFFDTTYDIIVAGKKANDPAIVHPIKGLRQITKRVVHGANFQMASYTLYISMGRDSVIAAAVAAGDADALGWPEERLIQHCGKLLKKYYALYPRLSKREWYGEIAHQLKMTSQIVSAYGMTRQFMGEWNDGDTQREATAFYGQAGTSGNMNRCTNEVDFGYIPPAFRDGDNPHANETPLYLCHPGSPFEVLLQGHDSFIGQVDTRHPKWRDYLNNFLTVMERPCIINGHSMHVPAEMDVGLAWDGNMIPWNTDGSTDVSRFGF